MSAEHEGPAGGRNPEAPKNAAKPPRGGSSLTDAVVAALAKVDDGKSEKPAAPSEPAPAEAGCAATAQAPKDPPPVVASAPQPALVEPAIVQPAAQAGPNGFRTGPGSFTDLVRRWSGGAPMAAPSAPPSPAPATEPPRVSEPPSVAVDPEPSVPALATPAPVPQVGPIEITFYGRTDVGLVREHNEDNFLVADLSTDARGVDAPTKVRLGERGCIFAVCDGMGGAAAGEVASQMAVDTIHEVFDKGGTPKDRDAFARRLVTAIEEAGHRIFSAAKMDRTRRGMGTTTTLAGLIDNVLFVGQVGDSRAYILRNQQLEQITKDQSLVNQLIEAGQLTEEEAEAFEHSNIILQALGTTEEVTVDLTFLELRPGDRLLLCSDGLSGLVHADMIKEALQESPDLADAATKLIQMANAGGGHDNISVIIADFAGEGLTAPVDARVHYQQYPLPPADSVEEQGAPRETSMKAGAPKPGADVKREDFAAATAEVAQPKGGGGTWILLVAAGLLLALLAGAWLVFGQGVFGGGEPSTETPEVPGAPALPTPEAPPPELVVEQPVRQEPAPATETGTIRVTTDVEDGATLFINGEPRGPLADGMTLELSPGAYNVEARSGNAQIVSQTVTVTAGEESAVALSVPAVPDEPPAADVRREPARTRPAVDRPRPRPQRDETGPLPSNPF